MIKLDKTKSYYLSDLSEEQKSIIKSYLVTNSGNWSIDSKIDCDYVYFHDNLWFQGDKRKEYTPVVNALELFYTLENVQVDCRELSEEQIKDMCKVYESNGYEIWDGAIPLDIKDCFYYFRLHTNDTNMYLVHEISENKHTITYDKFMELFSKEEKPKYLVWDRIDYGRKDFIVSCCNLTSSSKEEENVLTEIMKDEYKPTFCESYKSLKPQHYSKGIDTFKRMEENCTLEERLAFAKGNIDKYTWRTKGQDKEDFEKIISYAKWAIKQLENEQSTK